MKGLKIILLVVTGLLVIAGPVAAFSTHSVTVERSLDKTEAVVGETIRVTVTLSNLETAILRGFFYSEHIPQGLSVTTESVTVDGAPISGYTYESGGSGDVWTGSITHRWILETPISFTEDNPVPSGASVEIVYLLSSPATGIFELNEFNWVGYYQGASGAAFGHSEPPDRRTLEFRDEGGQVRPGDLNDDGTIDLTDAILALQVCAGMTPSSEVFVEADVNEDGVLGIADVTFILQTIGGLR